MIEPLSVRGELVFLLELLDGRIIQRPHSLICSTRFRCSQKRYKQDQSIKSNSHESSLSPTAADCADDADAGTSSSFFFPASSSSAKSAACKSIFKNYDSTCRRMSRGLRSSTPLDILRQVEDRKSTRLNSSH